jgi:hypothetical protein
MSKSSRTAALCLALVLPLAACGGGGEPEGAPLPQEELASAAAPAAGQEASAPTVAERTTRSPSLLIVPGDLSYRGAFKLPEGSNGSNWEYSGYAATYYPDGDPEGPDDGYPGSILAVGHDHHQRVSEISIPAPVVSHGKNPGDLNTASTLQKFHDITGGLFGPLEIPRAGLEYLAPRGNQKTGKLHFCWGQHFQFERVPSHGWSGLDLSSPGTAGLWYVGDYTNYVTNDYLFEIPEAWSAANTPGQRLATGRFRDGTWGGLGPALLAYGSTAGGDPPPPGSKLSRVTPLLLYGKPVKGSPELSVSQDMKMKSFKEADEWSGGAWLTASGKSAVIFVGTKATGKSWYGFSNGVVYPTSGDPNEKVPEVPPWPHDRRGWWSEGIQAQLLFYNPDDLADVAGGAMKTWEPQPYASLEIDSYLFDPGFDHEQAKRYLVGAAAFDRARGLLYLFERRADGDKSLVHVFKVGR